MNESELSSIPNTFRDATVAAPAVPPVLALVPEHVGDQLLTVDELGSRIVALAGRIAAATCRWLLLVAEFDARDGADAFGLANTPQWLSHHCGITTRTARDHVRVARALAAHPALADAMNAGQVSYSHARAIARAADPDEHDLVTDLLNMAIHGTVGQLETIVRGLRTVEDTLTDPGQENARRRGEHLTTRWDPDSRWRMTTRLDPEHGTVVQAALDAIASTAPKGEHLTGADALLRMAEITLAALHDSTTPPRPLRGHERAAIVVHVTAAAVPQPAAATDPAAPATTAPSIDGSAEPSPEEKECGSREPRPGKRTPGSAEPHTHPKRKRGPHPYGQVHEGPGLPGHVIERLACAGQVRLIVHGTTQPRSVLDAGRSRRVVNKRQFLALLIRDTHCAHPGCRSRDRLEAHHVRHWLHGGVPT